MKIFGYHIIETETIGHGEFWWDEYYETTEYKIIQTKLFKSEEERDNSKIEDEKKYYNEIKIEKNLFILSFEFDEIDYE